MDQLKLLFHHTSNSLREYFHKATGQTINLVITDNTASMLSISHKKRNTILIRMHWMFLHAGEDVIGEITAFIRNDKYRTPLITKFIEENKKCIRKGPVKPVSINVQGKYQNLKDIFDFLNTGYFDGRVNALITWGKRGNRWYAGKRTLGSYDESSNTIRINPVLDQKYVPKYFVEFIVYHEMIHADMDSQTVKGRNGIHTKELKKRERLFKHYKKALLWEQKHLK
jgi:hypothetical protein